MNEPEPLAASDLQEISSAGSAELTTSGLAEFQRLLQRANAERADILQQLEYANNEVETAGAKYSQWRNGWFRRRAFSKKYEEIKRASQEADAKKRELEEQAELAKIHTEIDVPAEVKSGYAKLIDAFAVLSQAQKIWDTTSHRQTNQIAERTSAARTITREEVKFRLGGCELIESQWSVPCLGNFNGGDLYIYPGFVLYYVSKQAFALLEIGDVNLQVTASRFIEEEGVPHDAKQVETTWAKVNKDGTPDKRFRDNYQIPVMAYGKIELSSSTGLNEEFMVSDVNAALAFYKVWEMFLHSVRQASSLK